MCLCVEYVSRKKSSNSFITEKNFARFGGFFGNKVEMSEAGHLIRVKAKENLNAVITVVQSMLFKINVDVMNGRLKWQVLTLDESSGKFEPWKEKPQAGSAALNLDSFFNSL